MTVSESPTIRHPGEDHPSSESVRASRPAPFGARLYVAILLALPAVFLLSSIAIVRSADFPSVSADPFLLNLDYPFSLRQANCEIVIYGDSTAITSVDPTVVQQATGLKTCNIAQSQSILDIAGPLALDTYLRNNTPPRYLLIQLSPETLSREPGSVFWPEGLTVLVRRRPLPFALFVMLRHPVESYNFALWAIKAKVAAMRHQTPDFSATQANFQIHRGLLTLPKPPETACLRNLPFLPPSRSYVDALRRKYTAPGTRVLVNVSPVPDCTRDAPQIAASMRGITDNALPLYPIHLFCDLDRHLTLEGADRAAGQVAKQIAAMLHPPQAAPGED